MKGMREGEAMRGKERRGGVGRAREGRRESTGQKRRERKRKREEKEIQIDR